MTRPWLIPAGAFAAVVLIIAGFFLGRATTSSSTAVSSASAIRAINGIPVGVQDTAAGALAAADNYVTEVTETGDQNPRLFERFVRAVYLPQRQAATLNQVQQQRAADPQQAKNFAAGGKGVAFVGARRLDSFTGGDATVTSWIEVIGWGPLQQPKQGWALVTTRLRWTGGQWRVDSLDGTGTPAPTPAQAVPSSPDQQTAQAFDSALKNMTTPFYGTGG